MRELPINMAFSDATNRPFKNEKNKSKREQKSYDANHTRLWYYLKNTRKCRCKRNVRRNGRLFSSSKLNSNLNRIKQTKIRTEYKAIKYVFYRERVCSTLAVARKEKNDKKFFSAKTERCSIFLCKLYCEFQSSSVKRTTRLPIHFTFIEFPTRCEFNA